MDWTKAKSILIVALLVTNLVLISTYLLQNSIQKNDEKEMLNATVRLLEQKNIFVNADIPQEHPRMGKLTVRYDKMDQTAVEEQLALQKELTDPAPTDDELIFMTSEFIRKCNLMTENVTFGSIDRKGSDILVTYKNYIKGIAIEDSYITCTVRDGKIVDFKRYWLNPVETGSMEKEVIPAGAALIKFMGENTSKEKIYVEGISLVYWLDSGSFDAESPVTDTAFPAWKITYNGGKPRYIPAWEQ